jgi:hypothetical protein
LLCLSLIGCGWKKEISFPSPSGRYNLEVYQPHFFRPANLRLDLVTDAGRRRAIYQLDHEIFLSFLYTYWSPKEDIVAVLACGSGIVRFAYDRRQGKAIAFDTVAVDVKKSLLGAYALPSGVRDVKLDPPYSPCLVDGWKDQFRQRYPYAFSDY